MKLDKKTHSACMGMFINSSSATCFQWLSPHDPILKRQKKPWQPLSIIFSLFSYNVKFYHKPHGIQFTCIRSSCSSGSTIRLSKKKKTFWLKCAVFGYYTE